MKPYQQVPIAECGEPLVPIPLDRFAREDPHPYIKVGAPYGEKSPYYLRSGVLARLEQAQLLLQQEVPHYKILVFDAYRPIAVQQYMVDYSFQQLVQAKRLNPDQLSQTQQQQLFNEVAQFWATPSTNPDTPPPHSTGAAIDVTLIDATGQAIDMGSPIDEMSPRSYPNHFDASDLPDAIQFHQNRQLLRRSMLAAGFRQHPHEWWHFSYGDQLWVWLLHQELVNQELVNQRLVDQKLVDQKLVNQKLVDQKLVDQDQSGTETIARYGGAT